MAETLSFHMRSSIAARNAAYSTGRTMKALGRIFALIALSAAASGCVAIAAGGVGYMIHDEATEKDGKFDPLEKARGKDDGKN